jgi:hypothetical protein
MSSTTDGLDRLPSRRALAPSASVEARGRSLREFLYRDELSDKEEAMPSIGQENLETVMIDFFGPFGGATSTLRRRYSIPA